MTKILIDRRVDEGGVGRYGDELIRALSRLERGPEVFQFNPKRRIRNIPFTPWGRLAVARRARYLGASVLHCLHLEAPRVGIPLVVTLHDVIPLEFPESMPSRFRRRIFRRILKQTLRRADALIVPSHRTARVLPAYGASPEKIHVVPHGAVGADLGEEQRRFARGRYGGGKPYVFAVMDPKPHKNPGVIPAVARALQDRGAVLLIRGEPWDAGDNVVFLPPVSEADMRILYGGSQALLCPSFAEGFGFPALEALACGTPVVCGPGMGAVEFIGDGCEVVDVSDADAVAAAVLAVAFDQARRASLIRSGLEAARSLTPERMARETMEVYHRFVPR